MRRTRSNIRYEAQEAEEGSAARLMSAKWEPVGTGRQLTAKDLIQEWRAAAFQGYVAKGQAERHIEDLVQRFLKKDPFASYHLDVYSRYDSILHVTSDDDVHNHGAEEPRPCGEVVTKVHPLRCGHLVFTEKESICLSNCQLGSDNQGQYFCLLCTRRNRHFRKWNLPDRWYKLLLPRASHLGTELAKACQPGAVDAQPAYLDPHGHIILPRIHCTIAMVLAFEERKEAEVKALIRTVSPDRMVIELFELFLEHHHQFNHADMNYLAFLATTLLHQERLSADEEVVLLHSLGAEAHPDHDAIQSSLREDGRVHMWGPRRYSPRSSKQSLIKLAAQ
jgi:hypothetical protein